MSCYTQPGFYSWETADIAITLEKDGVLDGIKDVIVSFVQGATRVDFHADDLEIDVATNTLTAHFTQEQAGLFTGNREAAVQVNVLYDDGERDVSARGKVAILPNLYEEVME